MQLENDCTADIGILLQQFYIPSLTTDILFYLSRSSVRTPNRNSLVIRKFKVHWLWKGLISVSSILPALSVAQTPRICSGVNFSNLIKLWPQRHVLKIIGTCPIWSGIHSVAWVLIIQTTLFDVPCHVSALDTFLTKKLACWLCSQLRQYGIAPHQWTKTQIRSSSFNWGCFFVPPSYVTLFQFILIVSIEAGSLSLLFEHVTLLEPNNCAN